MYIRSSATTMNQKSARPAQAVHGRRSSSNGDGPPQEQSSDDDSTPDGNARKRARLMPISCELCQQRKVKCDRAHPRCGWCTRNGQVCEYRERKKPGLRAGYGKQLESRLDQLEDLIRTQAQTLQTHIEATTPRPTHPASIDHILQQIPMQEPQLPEPNFSPEIFRAPAPAPIPQPRPQVDRTPSSFSAPATSPMNITARIQSGIPITPASDALTQPPWPQPIQTPINEPGAQPPEDSSVNQIQGHGIYQRDLPSEDILQTLVDLYFEHINTWCPILHRDAAIVALFGQSPRQSGDWILLHAIVVTALRFYDDPIRPLTEDQKTFYHDSSKQTVWVYSLENSSVKALQALVILSLDLIGSSNGPSGWNILALITRSVVKLGLCVEPTSPYLSPAFLPTSTLRTRVLPYAKDWIEEESRRRLFWMAYVLDRYSTVTTAFEFTLDDGEIDRLLPCKDELWSGNQAVETKWFTTIARTDYTINRPENLGSFSYYIEVLRILSQIHTFLKRPLDISSPDDVERWQREFRGLDQTLSTWKLSLPREYGNMSRLFSAKENKEVDFMWIMMHAIYQTTVIRLHSAAAYPTSRSLAFTPSYSAGQRCLTAVENISVLATYLSENNLLLKLGPHFVFTLWVAARLLLVYESTTSGQAVTSPEIGFFVATLTQMGRYWKVARRYATILNRVLTEHEASVRATGSIAAALPDSTGGAGERVVPSSVTLLADMRRNAYDLDCLMSSSEPASGANAQQPGNAAAAAAAIQMLADVPSVSPMNSDFELGELQYLDVFGFFNMPRVAEGTGVLGPEGGGLGGVQTQQRGLTPEMGGGAENIRDFVVDPNADWLLRGLG